MTNKIKPYRMLISSLVLSSVLTIAGGGQLSQACASAPIEARMTVTERRIHVSDQYVNINLSCPIVSGMADSAFQLKFNNAVKAEMERLAGQLELDAKASHAHAAVSGYPFLKYELSSAVEVHFNDGRVLSMATRMENYTGGAHGNRDSRFYLLLNEPVARQLTLPRLFTRPDTGIGMVEKYINGMISSQPDEYFPGAIAVIDSNTWFYMHDKELHIVFPTYSIAPYVAGEQEFSMPLSSFRGILIPEFS